MTRADLIALLKNDQELRDALFCHRTPEEERRQEERQREMARYIQELHEKNTREMAERFGALKRVGESPVDVAARRFSGATSSEDHAKEAEDG